MRLIVLDGDGRSPGSGGSAGGHEMKLSTQKLMTWFDWAESFIAKRKTYLAKRWNGCSASSIIVLTESENSARSLGCGAIGVEHLLVGLFKSEGRVFELLGSVYLSLETLRSEIERVWAPRRRDVVHFGCIPFTPRCKRVMERAYKRARLESARLVEPQDLFLELLEEKEGLVAALFQIVGANVTSLREALKL